MSRKYCIITAAISLLLFVSFSVSVAIGPESEPEIPDNYPVVCVYPEKIVNAEIGETFAVNVVVLDVENLYGFDIKLRWDPTIIEYVSHVVMAPVESYEEGILHDPVLLVKDEIDLAAGTYWVACASMSPAEPFDGNGDVFTMTFKIVSPLNEPPFELVNGMLSDNKGQPIVADEHNDLGVNGLVTYSSKNTKHSGHPSLEGWKRWWRIQMQRRWGTGSTYIEDED